MSLGLVGRKIGMTRIFTDDGTSLPVTVLDVSNNRVTQIKSASTDGYSAVQVAYGTRRRQPCDQSRSRSFRQSRCRSRERAERIHRHRQNSWPACKLARKVGVDLFQVGQKVDVTGVTIGKGYAGTIKRHHFKSGRAIAR